VSGETRNIQSKELDRVLDEAGIVSRVAQLFEEARGDNAGEDAAEVDDPALGGLGREGKVEEGGKTPGRAEGEFMAGEEGSEGGPTPSPRRGEEGGGYLVVEHIIRPLEDLEGTRIDEGLPGQPIEAITISARKLEKGLGRLLHEVGYEGLVDVGEEALSRKIPLEGDVPYRIPAKGSADGVRRLDLREPAFDLVVGDEILAADPAFPGSRDGIVEEPPQKTDRHAAEAQPAAMKEVEEKAYTAPRAFQALFEGEVEVYPIAAVGDQVQTQIRVGLFQNHPLPGLAGIADKKVDIALQGSILPALSCGHEPEIRPSR
jgi:hypothetical protein